MRKGKADASHIQRGAVPGICVAAVSADVGCPWPRTELATGAEWICACSGQ